MTEKLNALLYLLNAIKLPVQIFIKLTKSAVAPNKYNLKQNYLF